MDQDYNQPMSDRLSITFILQVDLNFVFVGFYITMICHFFF